MQMIKKLILTNLYLLGTTLSTKIALGVQRQGSRSGFPPGNTSDSFELPNPLGVTSIGGLIARIMNALYFVIPPIAVLMVIIGAFQILTAGGDPAKFKTGKQTITYAVIGIAIFLLADLLIGLVTELLGAETPEQP